MFFFKDTGSDNKTLLFFAEEDLFPDKKTIRLIMPDGWI